jgi:hypothetical protein
MKIPAEFTQYEWLRRYPLLEYSYPADSSAICENRKRVDSAVMKAAYTRSCWLTANVSSIFPAAAAAE